METIRLGLIAKQDLKLGTGQFEVSLPDGTIVSADEVDVGKLLEQYPVKTYATTALLPTTNVAAGSLARVSADGFLYLYSGSAWAIVGGSGSHNHAASEITSGQLAVARGGTGLNTSATVQGVILYTNGTGTWAELTPGSVGTFLKSGGAGANLSWDTPGISAHALDSHNDFSAITEAQGQIVYRGSSTWDPLDAGTSGYFLKTQGASANPTWAAAHTVLDAVTANTTVNSTASETTIYSKSIAAGTLLTNNALRLTLHLSMTEGGADTATIRLKYGATTLVTLAGLTPSGAATMRVEIMLVGDAATNAQIGSMKTEGSDSGMELYEQGTSAEDSTLAKTLLVSWQWSGANSTFTMLEAILEKLTV